LNLIKLEEIVSKCEKNTGKEKTKGMVQKVQQSHQNQQLQALETDLTKQIKEKSEQLAEHERKCRELEQQLNEFQQQKERQHIVAEKPVFPIFQKSDYYEEDGIRCDRRNSSYFMARGVVLQNSKARIYSAYVGRNASVVRLLFHMYARNKSVIDLTVGINAGK
jgi:hypothetical protein